MNVFSEYFIVFQNIFLRKKNRFFGEYVKKCSKTIFSKKISNFLIILDLFFKALSVTFENLFTGSNLGFCLCKF